MPHSQYPPMFYDTSPAIFELASQLRNNMTIPELRLWEQVKGNQLEGLKFRRQHPMGPFIADFYCHPVKLVIEIDGAIHNKIEIKMNDLEREIIMKKWGVSTLRFSNDEVINDLQSVMRIIKVKVIELKRLSNSKS